MSKRKRHLEYDINKEKELHQQKASVRQRELKKKAYSKILQDDEDAQALRLNDAQSEDDEESYYGEDYDEGKDQSSLSSDTTKSEIPIEPFNLHKELDEGYFDKQGHYIEKASYHDAWYEDCLEQMAVTKKKVLEVEFENKPKPTQSSETDLPEDLQTLKNMLVEYLNPGESVLKALVRHKEATALKKKEKKSSEKADSDIVEKHDENFIKRMRQTIERITEIATQCLTLGVYVYSETRESLLASKDFPFEESQWEYKFDLKQEAFYGPYSHSQMLQWYNEGYFSAEDCTLHLRRAGSEEPFVVYSESEFLFGPA